MIRGVLFDMDGVLVNNTQAHVKAFEIFCERYGVEDWQHKLQTAFGMGNDDIMRLILPEEIIREKGMKALGEEKEAIYREVYAPEIRPVRGLVELLEELRRRGIRCAVGSSGCRENVDFVLSNCGITDYFSCIVSGDRVTRCKPDPEIYLLAAEGLHLPSAECLVFEDARVGITAARRAGAGRGPGNDSTPSYARNPNGSRCRHRRFRLDNRSQCSAIMSRALATIALLILSNTFMTLAWYGHIAFKSKIERFGMLSIILLSWGIALFEYCFQVPANRIGSSQLGGPFSIWELKVIQEVISLLVFTVFAVVFMKSDTLRWNHLAGFVCLILAVYFIFRK